MTLIDNKKAFDWMDRKKLFKILIDDTPNQITAIYNLYEEHVISINTESGYTVQNGNQ